ncbi:MAG: hypothetical protein GY786_14120 [Proteobacteria bacterium]|nr:hypothetical protein [Pseudomonadota bacterium]
MITEKQLEKLEKKFPVLSKLFSAQWDQPLSEFSKRFYIAEETSLEPELLAAFQEEWTSLGIAPEKSERAIKQLCELPVLQTSHHVTPTNGPGFLSIDLISLSGLPEGALYLVAANSGVAFSNSAWTGSFSYGSSDLSAILKEGSPSYRKSVKSARERISHGDKDHRMTLIPARQRDQLVYGTPIDSSHKKVIPDLMPELSPLIASMDEGALYSHWAVKCSNLIQNQIFRRDSILYFDINQVIKRYLLKVLLIKNHPITKLLFERGDLWSNFGYPALFLKNYRGKKSNKVDPLIWSSQGLSSGKTGIHSLEPEDIIVALEENRYCPAVFLLFFILRFLNGIKCLGSFNQIEYIESFRQNWLSARNDWNLNLTEDWQHSLTTGRWVEKGEGRWSLDSYLKNETIDVDEYAQTPMSQFWEPIVTLLTD